MLYVMSLAFKGSGGSELFEKTWGSLEERRKQIFDVYLQKMFQRSGATAFLFPKEKVIDWLSWIAWNMRKHSLSVFLIEELEPSWFNAINSLVIYESVVLLTAFAVGFLISTPGIWQMYSVIDLPSYRLILSLFVTGDPGSLLFSVLPLAWFGIQPIRYVILVETLGWRWFRLWKNSVAWIVLIVALLVFGHLSVPRFIAQLGVGLFLVLGVTMVMGWLGVSLIR